MVDPLDPRLNEQSQAVFHNKYFLPVAAVAATFSDGTFNQAVIAKRLNVQPNLVMGPLKRLKNAGLCKPTSDGLERVPGKFWDFLTAWCEELAP
jgi:hypothetical protein